MGRSPVTVAALYIETGGCYYGLKDVDPWDQARDTRLYAGPWPVVAHPPCNRWSLMAQCRGLRDGQDDGCFEAALEAVRTFGGVLEHPAHSLAWERFGLPLPCNGGWSLSLTDLGCTTEVDQSKRGPHANTHNNHSLRSATPPAFRDVLLNMARSAAPLDQWADAR
jgi:hypothetical protein